MINEEIFIINELDAIDKTIKEFDNLYKETNNYSNLDKNQILRYLKDLKNIFNKVKKVKIHKNYNSLFNFNKKYEEFTGITTVMLDDLKNNT